MAEKLVVVLDTNVFVSGLLSSMGAPGIIFQRFRLGQFSIVTSKMQIKEIQAVLARPSLKKALPPGTPRDILKFFAKLKRLTDILDPPELPWDFGDRDDHFLLDLAAHAKAQFLVTGDKALQRVLLVGQCAVV